MMLVCLCFHIRNTELQFKHGVIDIVAMSNAGIHTLEKTLLSQSFFPYKTVDIHAFTLWKVCTCIFLLD